MLDRKRRILVFGNARNSLVPRLLSSPPHGEEEEVNVALKITHHRSTLALARSNSSVIERLHVTSQTLRNPFRVAKEFCVHTHGALGWMLQSTYSCQ